MATGTPRRPSYNPSMSDLSSPPSSLPRRASSSAASTFTDSPHGTTPGTDRKKRNRTLLRDYYGLGPNKGDPLDIDTPETFNPNAYFHNLTSTASLPDLLKRETDLLNEIRELDGERQSLVYNHHHELIEASDTIRKMKSRAEALDTSLDSLKTSFERISQLSTSLAPALEPTRVRSNSINTHTPTSSQSFRNPEFPSSPETPTKPVPSRSNSSPAPTFSPLLHLAPLLSLPILLRVLDRSKGDALWGSWEPALRSWEDEGVEGVEEVGRECREVLRGGRRASVSVSLHTGNKGEAEGAGENAN